MKWVYSIGIKPIFLFFNTMRCSLSRPRYYGFPFSSDDVYVELWDHYTSCLFQMLLNFVFFKTERICCTSVHYPLALWLRLDHWLLLGSLSDSVTFLRRAACWKLCSCGGPESVCAGFINPSSSFFNWSIFVYCVQAQPQSITGHVQHPEDRARPRVHREGRKERGERERERERVVGNTGGWKWWRPSQRR